MSTGPNMIWQPPVLLPPLPVARRRPPIVRWLAAAFAFALLIAGGAVLHRTVLSKYFGGAGSPEQAVTMAIAAIEKGDPQQFALMLAPDEVGGFGDLQKQLDRISAALGENADIIGSSAADFMDVSVEKLDLSTHQEQRALSKVSIENADITVVFDTSKMSEAMRKSFADEQVPERSTISIRGDTVTTDGQTENSRFGGRAQPPFVMTVERDGSWYVSPFFSVFQYRAEEEGLVTSPTHSVPGFESPVAAAEAYLSALATTMQTRDVSAIADASGGFEGRLLQTYRDVVNGWLFDSDYEPFDSIEVTASEFTLLSVDGNTARVRPDRILVTATRAGEKGEFDLAGTCLTVDTPQENEQYCLDGPQASLFKPLVERLKYFVAVRADGGWKLSVTRTVLSWLTDIFSWVGEAELPILKAFMHSDPAEFVKTASVAATVPIDDTGTVSINPIGPYLAGGYAIIDVPNPDGDDFMVYCRAKGRHCEVLTIISPSGEPQSPFAGGEPGTYKAAILAPTGNVDVSVESY